MDSRISAPFQAAAAPPRPPPAARPPPIQTAPAAKKAGGMKVSMSRGGAPAPPKGALSHAIRFVSFVLSFPLLLVFSSCESQMCVVLQTLPSELKSRAPCLPLLFRFPPRSRAAAQGGAAADPRRRGAEGGTRQVQPRPGGLPHNPGHGTDILGRDCCIIQPRLAPARSVAIPCTLEM